MVRAMTRAYLVVVVVVAACSSAPAVVDAPGPSDASGASPVDLAGDLAPIAAQYQVPAMAALAADETTILGRGVTGVRKLGDPTLATNLDRWHLGSDTKAMTATLIAGYVEAGTLGWDTKLPQLFPAITVDAGYRDVTLAMLLAHVGGLPADLPADVETTLSGSGTPRDLRLAAVQQLLTRAPATTPGTYSYANAGYIVAGAALELAANAAWEDLITRKLFQPLAMASCGFGPSATAGTVDAPWGHVLENGALVAVNLDNPPALGPAGTVHCSLVDWLAFLREHLNGATGAPTVLGLQAATWAKLHAPYAGSDYAMGWIVASRPWANGIALTHVGDNTLNVADVWIAPSIHRIYLSTGNRGDDPAISAADSAVGKLVTRFPAP
jgi:CubicO group peptidase (beta-lactamase class C family)